MHSWPHTRRYLAFECRRIWQQGLLRILWKILRHLLSAALWFLLLPLTLALHAIGYRRVNVFTDRIGHLAIEPDCLLKAQALGRIRAYRWLLLAPPARVANQHLLAYWKQHMHVMQHPWLCFIVGSMSRCMFMQYDVSRYIRASNTAQEAYEIHARWGPRAPLLSLTPDDEAWSRRMLEQLGLPKGAWFVCVHARETGFSTVDDELHSHRNGNIAATIPAMQEIVRRGGWVIRIGDPAMQELPAMAGVIDYAHHPLKCDRLDVILCAKARFILGNSSGIALVGKVFGAPCAIANMIPAPDLWFGTRDLCIPKLLWSIKLGRHLRFAEAMSLPVGGFRYASLYQEAGLVVQENTTGEILELTQEMLARLDADFKDTVEDTERAKALARLRTDGHYAYASASRTGALFLRRHADLC